MMINKDEISQSKKLLFVTGTRADFGKLQPLASEAHKSGFKITFFITGMHMLDKYGLTKEEVRSYEEFETIEFLNQRDGDPQDVILSKTISHAHESMHCDQDRRCCWARFDSSAGAGWEA